MIEWEQSRSRDTTTAEACGNRTLYSLFAHLVGWIECRSTGRAEGIDLCIDCYGDSMLWTVTLESDNLLSRLKAIVLSAAVGTATATVWPYELRGQVSQSRQPVQASTHPKPMLHACSSPFLAAAPRLPTPRCSLAGLAPAVPEISLQIQIHEILQLPPGSSSSGAVLGKIFPFRLPAAQVPC